MCRGRCAEVRLSSRWFRHNGSLRWIPSLKKLKRLLKQGKSSLSRSVLPRFFTTGWIISRIGASAGSCGGGIAFQSGIARIAEKRSWRARRRRNAPSVAVTAWSRIRMYWILGSLRGCGLSRCLAGQMKPLITSTFIPPQSWRRGMTSSSSGWHV